MSISPSFFACLTDTWSYLGCFLTQDTEMTGAFLCREDNGDRGCDVYMDGTAVWTVTGDSQVRDLYTAGDEILDDQGKTVSIVSADGTSYVDGDSDYTITVTGTYGTDDLTAFEHVPGIGTVADGEYTFEPQKAEEYVNLDYTPTAPDGTVYTEAAWGAEDEAPAEEPEESIVETRISAVESTVIEEVADIVFLENLQNPLVVGVVHLRILQLIANRAQGRGGGVVETCKLLRILLVDDIELVVENALDAVGRAVNGGDIGAFQCRFKYATGAGVDDGSGASGLAEDTRAGEGSGH